MFRPLTHSHRRLLRRGTSILLIAIIMLALFSAVGTAYVFFAIREARQAQARKEEQSTSNALAAPNPAGTVNAFFGGLICGTADDGTDLFNSLRGHDLARAMYGRDYLVHSTAINQPYTTANTWALTTPWSGPGRFHEDPTTYGAQYNLTGFDRAQFINYTLMLQNGNPFLLDPEYMNVRPGVTTTTVPAFSGTLANRPFVGKNAPYTYPDLNNFHLAAIDPATGQVMLPSFHRPALFNATVGTTTYDLNPSNPNWTNAPGLLKTLRPRPAEHPSFPRVPPNADGTYTGDVQNWPGGYTYLNGQYYARNDSLWMNIGLQPIQLGNKKVIPLVAPLIVPLDGLFNASAHGNILNNNTAHTSYTGYGPWEVNLSYLLGADATTLVQNTRGNPVPRQYNGASSLAYAPFAGNLLPDYAPVMWSYPGGVSPVFAYPTGSSIVGLPTFTNFQNNNTPVSPHPALFNPSEWAAVPINPPTVPARTFPLSDLKRLQRFGFTPNWYDQADLIAGNYTPNSLQTTPGARSIFNIAPTQNTPANYNYRLDPNHLNRGLIMPRSYYTLDRPKLVPNFPTRDQTNALSFGTNVNVPNKPGLVSPTTYPSPLGATVGTVTDFASQTRWSNVQAALASVNLNRPLADYRANTALALASTNMANPTATGQLQADIDRQQLASDIFARLIVALGAAGYVDTNPATGAVRITLPTSSTPPMGLQPLTLTPPTGGTPVVYTQQQYDALRYLAQLAVNIVDYIDNDDISTVFQWNPTGSPTDIVYGVEKPRLVINEAYSEITNAATDPVDGAIVMGVQQPPTGQAQVRFWLELLNPTQTLTTAPNPGPLGNGSVPLNAYQIQIRRETRTTGLQMGVNADTNGFGNNQATALFTYLPVAGTGNATNTTGSFSSTADTTVSLSTINLSINPNLPLPPALPTNAYSPPPATLSANGFVLLGPPNVTPKVPGGEEFAPAGGVWQNIQTPGAMGNATASSALGYTFDLQGANTAYAAQEFKRHIVLLRRLANPYLVFNAQTNPYITVDLMDFVPSFDAVHRGKNDGPNRKARSAMNMPGYDPINDPTPTNNRFAIGKVQPYAGHATTTAVPSNNAGTYNQYLFGNPAGVALSSMVLAQNPTNAPAANYPRSTFGQHNGINTTQPTGSTYLPGVTPQLKDPTAGTPQTLMLPYDWFIHMDRPLVNQIELFQVRDTPPYRVTDQFITPNITATASNGSITGVSYGQGIARWRFLDDGIARALEYLTVKPYTSSVPHGGRLPGQINLNVVQAPPVIQGLFDPQPGNMFDTNFVYSTGGTDTVWSKWMASRTPTMQQFFQPNPSVPGVSRPVPTLSKFDDYTNGVDFPFLPFGAPAATAGGTFAYGAPGWTGTDATFLRRANNTGRPLLFANMSSRSSNPPVYTTALPDGPTYTQDEPLRKIYNNSTTVSHTYLVFLTIGYFDVDTVNGPISIGGLSTPRLGAEAFISVPGDLRQKYIAVIDMSNMALQPATNSIASGQPFFTSVTQTTYGNGTASATLNIVDTGTGGTVISDGNPVTITVGSQLVVGFGTEQQIVTVTGVAAGQVTVTTVSTLPLRTVYAGTCVSNVRPGHPGVQPNFDYTQPQYGPVIPYVERLR